MATSLNSLAGLYKNQGRYEEAEPFYLSAVMIFVQRLGQNHPNTQTVLNNFVQSLREALQAGQGDRLSNHSLTQDFLKQLRSQF